MVLFYRSGARDYELENALTPEANKRLIRSAVKLLLNRGQTTAAKSLQDTPFQVYSAINSFMDDFHVLFVEAGVARYEELKQVFASDQGKAVLKLIADVITEIGPYIRLVALELDLSDQTVQGAADLTEIEINRLVYKYIGVNDGYLGDFSYRTHHEFYVDLGLEINPYSYDGTTRERFIQILSEQAPLEQATIIEGILDRYPVGTEPMRTIGEYKKQQAIINRLRGNQSMVPTDLKPTKNSVMLAIQDAEEMISNGRPASAVDRTHTMLHGYLVEVCENASIAVPKDPSVTLLFKLVRESHPAFAESVEGDTEIIRVVKALSSAADALNTIRNRLSVAHPNDVVLQNPEAVLAINAARTIIAYLRSRIDAHQTGGK